MIQLPQLPFLFSFSLGNDVLGAGEATKALTWTSLAEKALQPSGMGGMAAIATAAFLGWKIIEAHRDPASPMNLFELRWITVPLVDLALFAVGVKLLFF